MSGSEENKKTAVVLSGGGATGAYEVGVMKALVAGKSPATGFRPLEPDVFTGTSIGSFSSAFMVSQWDEYGAAAAANLETAWLTRLAGNYRIRLNPIELLNPNRYVPNPFRPLAQFALDSAIVGWDMLRRTVNVATARGELLEERVAQLVDFASFVDPSPWLETIQELIDFGKARTSSRGLCIAATNWMNGEVRLFFNRDMVEGLGPQTVQCSSAIPGFFPPIRIGAEPYVDGGVLMNTPLKPAIDLGADEIHLIYLDPDVSAIPLSDIRNTLGTIYRMMTIGWAATVNDDIEDANLVNEGIAILNRFEEGQELDSEEILRSLSKVRKNRQRFRPLTIHRYHPRDDIAGGAVGLINFDSERLRKLIRRGFTDAQLHDCKLAGCILADSPRTDDIRPLEETGAEARSTG